MNDDWFDLLQALADAGARYLVVGAHAMAVHGVPRGTQDLDVWVEPSPGNAERVWRALARFGAPLTSPGVTREDLDHPGQVLQVGVPPFRIDLLTSITGIPDFESAWSARAVHAVRGLPVPFLGRSTLVRNKRAGGRPKDLADLDALGELPPLD